MQGLAEIRLRTKISQGELDGKKGKVLSDQDYNVLLTGPTQVRKPNGDTLCVYLPGAIDPETAAGAYPILTKIRGKSGNRGLASGSEGYIDRKQRRWREVYSSIIGSFEKSGGGRFPYCRQTAWTAQHRELWEAIHPYTRAVAELMKEYVPGRYAVQSDYAARTHRDWVIPGTPYTTITVNNTYETGVHQDAGDLEAGFSCLSTLRRGSYTGGRLCFAEWRVAVDMQDRDLILMNAHDWHGNTEIVKGSPDAERISTVFYYRTGMIECGSMVEEIKKARAA